MIRRLGRAVTALAVYFCLATVTAQLILAALLAVTWQLDRTKVVQILAIAQGVDLLALHEQALTETESTTQEQISYEQIREARAAMFRDLELREQELRSNLQQVRFEQNSLREGTQRTAQLKQGFEQQLLALKQQVTTTGMEDVRSKLESLKARQAKELLVQMIDGEELDDVVVLLGNMPNVKAAKIIAEFKTPEEAEKIGEVLRRIRTGGPQADLAAATRAKLQGTAPK